MNKAYELKGGACRVVSVIILFLDQFYCIFLPVQEKSHLLRSYQIPNSDHSETCSLLPGGLQETHTDTGWLVYTGRSELAQRPGYFLTQQKFQFFMQIFWFERFMWWKKAYMFMLKVIGIYFFVSAKGHEHVWRVDYGICPP